MSGNSKKEYDYVESEALGTLKGRELEQCAKELERVQMG
jgi:hypothetical protein